MISPTTLTAFIEKTAAELEAEEARIAEAVAAKAIGDGGSYWQKAYRLRSKLRVAMEIREAIREARA